MNRSVLQDVKHTQMPTGKKGKERSRERLSGENRGREDECNRGGSKGAMKEKWHKKKGNERDRRRRTASAPPPGEEVKQYVLLAFQDCLLGWSHPIRDRLGQLKTTLNNHVQGKKEKTNGFPALGEKPLQNRKTTSWDGSMHIA